MARRLASREGRQRTPPEVSEEGPDPRLALRWLISSEVDDDRRLPDPFAWNVEPFSKAYKGRRAFASASRPPMTTRYVPFARSMSGYSGARLRTDVVAGVTVAALALPSSMAYAELAGVPVSAGLYALLLPVLAYALLGSAPRVVVGPGGHRRAARRHRARAAGRGREPRVRRAGRDARAPGRRRLPARPGGPARLDRRLLLTGRPGRLHHRGGHRADPGAAGQARRGVQRRGRGDS